MLIFKLRDQDINVILYNKCNKFLIKVRKFQDNTINIPGVINENKRGDEKGRPEMEGGRRWRRRREKGRERGDRESASQHDSHRTRE